MNQAKKFASSIDTQLSRWLGAIPILIPILQRLNVVSIINRYCLANLVPPSNGRTELMWMKVR
jgi:hypothetical protein